MNMPGALSLQLSYKYLLDSGINKKISQESAGCRWVEKIPASGAWQAKNKHADR